MKKSRVSETELAAKVVEWLTGLQWDVYQEVQFSSGSHCADIAAIQGRLLWIIECKTSSGLAVMEQAHAWLRSANYVSIAVPGASAFARQICRQFGIGVLNVGHDIYESTAPALRRIPTKKLRERLDPEHKTFAAAGTNSGRRWTPFQKTCQNVANYVSRRPGVSIKDLVKNIDTHYASSATARTCLKMWIEEGKVPGVKIERDGRSIMVYPC